MKTALATKLTAIGWEEVYSEFTRDGEPIQTGSGDWVSISCPFRWVDHDDTPSFRLNVVEGVFKCYKTDLKGDFVKFYAYYTATEFDQAGKPVANFAKAERELLVKYGVVNLITEEWLAKCVEELRGDLTFDMSIRYVKPWIRAELVKYQIGYDVDEDRIVLPIRDQGGKLIDAKLYKPGAHRKMIHKVDGIGGNFLFPYEALKEDTEGWHLLQEGEPDAISLRHYGYPAISGTLGSGVPVPEGSWVSGKIFYVLTDNDPAGRKSAEIATRQLRDRGAIKVFQCYLPDWPGKPQKADSSDYIMWLRDTCEYSFEQITEAIDEVLASGILVDFADIALESIPEETTFAEALSGKFIGKRISFIARVIARSTTRYFVPEEYQLTCPTPGHPYCKSCPMALRNAGLVTRKHDIRNAETLELFKSTTRHQINLLKGREGIPGICQEPKLHINTAGVIEPVIISESAREVADDHDRMRRDAFFILKDKRFISENTDYEITAFVYSHPVTQQAVFLVDEFEEISGVEVDFEDEDTIEKLKMFSVEEGTNPYDSLEDVAFDFEKSYTFIRGRKDLHMAYRSTFFSAISFDLGPERINRGWIEGLIIGDTRTGKSKTFVGMSAVYSKGMLVDGKMQTEAGMLGSVQQSNMGDYYVTQGIYPQHDNDIVAVDEFTNLRGGGVMAAMSYVRAEGRVVITKAGSAEFLARVRSLWFANPGQGELMKDLPDSGIKLIPKIILQPEDIARFDFAIAVTQDEVPVEALTAIQGASEPKYSVEAHRLLLRWAWTRKPDQFIWTEAAQDYLSKIVRWMLKKYSPRVPLVEPSDQKARVAKLAVSVAMQVFSTDESYQNVIIKPEHVDAAKLMFIDWYDKKSMGYDVFSRNVDLENSLRNEEEVRDVFDKKLLPYGVILADMLLRTDRLNIFDFGSMVNLQQSIMQQALGILRSNNCFRPDDKRNFQKTASFTKFLINYIKEKRKVQDK